MGCKVYETFLSQYPEPSPAYEKVFSVIESLDTSVPLDKANRMLKDSLVDGFPQHFKYDNAGDI